MLASNILHPELNQGLSLACEKIFSPLLVWRQAHLLSKNNLLTHVGQGHYKLQCVSGHRDSVPRSLD